MFTLWTQEGLNIESGRWGWILAVIDCYSKGTIEVKKLSFENLVKTFIICFFMRSSLSHSHVFNQPAEQCTAQLILLHNALHIANCTLQFTSMIIVYQCANKLLGVNSQVSSNVYRERVITMFTLWTQEGLNIESGRWGWLLAVIDCCSKGTIEVKKQSCEKKIFFFFFSFFLSSLMTLVTLTLAYSTIIF